jgi:ornithine cyclodeaminase/alanine dehydrogenase-like protein (mu-crystallin family)
VLIGIHPPFVGAEELRRVVTMDAAIDALEAALVAGPLPEAPPRSGVETGAGELLLMPAAGNQGIGVKVVTVAPGNPARGRPLVQAVYALFDPDTLAPEALFDGSALTALRTAAVSGLATRHLARRDASRLVLFGAGVQATAHLEAMTAVRSVERVWVVSRTLDRAERLAARAAEAGLRADTAPPDAVSEADLICTCTPSPRPVFDGDRLRPGTHINAVGAYRPDQREVDDDTVRKARIAVETREAALAEAGDLLIPMGSGVIQPADIVADLAEVAQGAPVRRGPDDITLFKSVGVAFEDLIVARAAADRLARGLGADGPTR